MRSEAAITSWALNNLKHLDTLRWKRELRVSFPELWWSISFSSYTSEIVSNRKLRILPQFKIYTENEGRWAGRGQGNLLSLGWETILEGGWTTSGPTAWRCGRKWEYYHIIIFPERIWDFTSRKKRTNENHSNGTLLWHPLPQIQTC